MSGAPGPGGFLLYGRIDGRERSYLLRAGLNRIGRHPGNDLVLAVDGVSKRHAALIVSGHRVRFQDLASKNGAFVNGRRALDVEVAAGDELGFGPVRLTLLAAPSGEGELAVELPVRTPPAVDEETTVSPPPETPAESWRRRLRFPPGYVPGESASMRELYRQMASLARSELPVLILGETGVGKEAVARTLHASSPRAGGPFVAINCAAIPHELMEAELFGVTAGAATGVAARAGLLRAAAGGSVLLDEIGDLPLDLQGKLLRALEEREAQPLGGRPVSLDVRVIAATNGDLSALVARGGFRRDLYYRIAGCVLTVPPLAARPGDVPALVARFLDQAAREARTRVRGLTVGALERLCERPWPGNVRQLEHEVRRLVYLAADSETITERTLAAAEADGRSGGGDPAGADGDLELAALERRAITEALRRAQGNQARAARLLGISRYALRRRLDGRHPTGGGAD
ncbi:MAG TPA: sigma 54-interacting transcriptional regulator [Thermoanaerobaculia bacterium]